MTHMTILPDFDAQVGLLFINYRHCYAFVGKKVSTGGAFPKVRL